MDEIDAYVAERDEMLRSLDIEAALAFHAKWNSGIGPPPRQIVEIAMHKARTAALSMTQQERQSSAQWLAQRGYSSLA